MKKDDYLNERTGIVTTTTNETKILQKLISYRRELHEHPELSMKEYETTDRIRHWLQEAEITIRGSRGNPRCEPGPTIA